MYQRRNNNNMAGWLTDYVVKPAKATGNLALDIVDPLSIVHKPTYNPVDLTPGGFVDNVVQLPMDTFDPFGIFHKTRIEKVIDQYQAPAKAEAAAAAQKSADQQLSDKFVSIYDQNIGTPAEHNAKWHVGYFISEPSNFINAAKTTQEQNLKTIEEKNGYIRDLKGFFAPINTDYIQAILDGNNVPIDKIGWFMQYKPEISDFYNQRFMNLDFPGWAKAQTSAPVQLQLAKMTPAEKINWQNNLQSMIQYYAPADAVANLDPITKSNLMRIVYPTEYKVLDNASKGIVTPEQQQIVKAGIQTETPAVGGFDYNKIIFVGIASIGLYFGLKALGSANNERSYRR